MIFRRKKQRGAVDALIADITAVARVDVARARTEARLQEELATAALAHAAELRRQYENRIADLKESYDRAFAETQRTIKALADEVEYLRLQHFGHGVPMTHTAMAASVKALPDREPSFMEPANPLYMSEEEEDLRAMHDAGLVDDIEFKRILESLRGATGLPVAPEINF